MRLQRIYSSKLYVTSSRKDRIHAAITNPMNAQLVQQLSSYLDDDAKEKLHEAIKSKEKAAEEAKEAAAPKQNEGKREDNFPDAENNVFSPSYSGGSSSSSSDFDDFGDSGDEPNIFDIPEGDEGGDIPEAPSDAPVEEATIAEGIAITADTDIDDVVFDVANDLEVIKATLNGRADTAGIQRINVDDKELWIYYKDEVNIGDIMVDVIEVLNGANYTYLTFSRLARSNNAIVFDISANLKEPMKTMQEIEEENK